MEQSGGRGSYFIYLFKALPKQPKHFPDSSKVAGFFVSADFKARLGLRCLVKMAEMVIIVFYFNSKVFLFAVFRGTKIIALWKYFARMIAVYVIFLAEWCIAVHGLCCSGFVAEA